MLLKGLKKWGQALQELKKLLKSGEYTYVDNRLAAVNSDAKMLNEHVLNFTGNLATVRMLKYNKTEAEKKGI